MKSNNWKAATALALALALASAVFSGYAVAADITFTAEFKPSVENPANNRFVNTTPLSGYCVEFPNQCVSNGTFSVSLPIGQIAYDWRPSEVEGTQHILKFPRDLSKSQ